MENLYGSEEGTLGLLGRALAHTDARRMYLAGAPPAGSSALQQCPAVSARPALLGRIVADPALMCRCIPSFAVGAGTGQPGNIWLANLAALVAAGLQSRRYQRWS